ncbi:hypothetical protein EVAR_2902_1 [Eumeta japonica]|uniref:Uncharacterized protein n=1 Tax=Eumeta variegata TaxID=151549 RepID=A0A4C1T4B2_EUMVA|nr:hypothetical protein EVAR_2902_1 [Eumeta japonica]
MRLLESQKPDSARQPRPVVLHFDFYPRYRAFSHLPAMQYSRYNLSTASVNYKRSTDNFFGRTTNETYIQNNQSEKLQSTKGRAVQARTRGLDGVWEVEGGGASQVTKLHCLRL